ncbi:hypothetical protein CJ030_MR3G009554 [Morella rubra]|uniref:Uncharacterized protein n=1 Tax=Morella rubra TaxID=262757 RepID=A0A6A1W3W4_9ROSI|nr:hypothetical protein CJ030_MR3G009554 [Morella rubra]
MAEIYSSVAENIMSRDLEISAEMDTESLGGWVEERKGNPNLLKSLIREHLTQQRGTTRPYSQRGGWHYWQRPSGENAAGAKRGRPAPGEHSIGRKGGPDGGRARGGRVI